MAYKTVVVTGGTRGIGRAIVEKFATLDYNVVCIYKNSYKIAKEIEQLYTNVECIACDIANYNEVLDISKQILSKYNKIDVLINNAGISICGLLSDNTEQDFDNIFGVNVKGVFNITKAFVDNFVSNKSGSIINISSMWGEVGASFEVLYSATKGAINSFTKALAKELGPSNIRVNAITPGVIETEMLSDIKQDEICDLIDQTPLMKIGKPLDIANICEFLAADNSSFITGQIIGVNGGFCI